MKPTPEEKNCDNCSKCENIGDGCYAYVASDPIIVKENDCLAETTMPVAA